MSTPLGHFFVTLGGVPATVLSAEMTPNEIGVFQVEIVVPQLSTGVYSVAVIAPNCTPYGCEEHGSNSPSLPIKYALLNPRSPAVALQRLHAAQHALQHAFFFHDQIVCSAIKPSRPCSVQLGWYAR